MQVGVIGLGRFGFLWARFLAERFPVIAYNRSPGKTVPDGVCLESLEEVAASPVVFLCVAISAVKTVAAQIAPLLTEDSLVADTCSVKVYPLSVLEAELPSRVQILGTHPMFGPDSVRGGMQGLPMILCPRRISKEGLDYWQRFFSDSGLSTRIMSADEHDREAAFTQGVTHFIGRVLADLQLQPSTIATLGYRKLLEVMEQTCNDPWQLFVDLQRYNPHTGEMRAELQHSLSKLLDELDVDLDRCDAPG